MRLTMPTRRSSTPRPRRNTSAASDRHVVATRRSSSCRGKPWHWHQALGISSGTPVTIPLMRLPIALAVVALAAVSLPAQTMSEARKILSVDHKVAVKSTVPAIAGQTTQIYLRERIAEGLKNPGADRVVLFVHGAGTPAEVAFDVPTGDYSWMAHLAKAGFDTFSMDTTGYGRSTRPAQMNDPCNLS